MRKVRVQSEVLRTELLRRNQSYKEFAAQLRISRSYLCQLLSGVRCPSPQVRARLMQELRTDNFDALFEPLPDGIRTPCKNRPCES
jgi:transcriptional regulator with XRE-family HTH domain